MKALSLFNRHVEWKMLELFHGIGRYMYLFDGHYRMNCVGWGLRGAGGGGLNGSVGRLFTQFTQYLMNNWKRFVNSQCISYCASLAVWNGCRTANDWYRVYHERWAFQNVCITLMVRVFWVDFHRFMKWLNFYVRIWIRLIIFREENKPVLKSMRDNYSLLGKWID